ncbi:zinc finger protein 184-like [Culicoides brevitarsis]|uniref:zinc finger protein 184-like n=1 Tax=Culicoides brevitarsis TaxID=469753 RepID=UPI00307B7DFC
MKLLCIDINICRVCKRQSEVSSQSIFETDLGDKFRYLTGLQATPDDGLPSKLCEKCIMRLKVAFDFKKESHSADTNFRQFIAKVNAQFQELTIINETSTNDSDLELLVTANSVSAAKPEKSQSQSFVQGVRLQPQSTNLPTTVVHQVPAQEAPKEEIYSFDMVEDEQEAEEIEEETIEEYHTVAESPQVVYIAIDNQNFNEQQNSVKEQKTNENPVKPPKEAGKEHYCSQCDKSFSTKTNLFRHVATHDGRRPYVCNVCQKRFSQNSSLKQHHLLHTGEKPYKCSVCEQSFTQSKSLTFHMRRHTGEKPFRCEICNTMFRQKDGLKRHILLKHEKKEPREIFSCDICTKVLFSRYSLANHKRKHANKDKSSDKGEEKVSVVKVGK